MLIHDRSHKLISLATAFLFCVTIFSIYSYGQDEVVRVYSDLVTVPVTVLDRQGRHVTDLSKSDFSVVEDGVEQTIDLFESTVEPFTALLLVDNSGSMKNHVNDLSRAANAFLDRMRDQDSLIVATFSDQGKIQIVHALAKRTVYRDRISFRSRVNDGYTTTFDAVEKGLKLLNKISGRKAMVLFTDGEIYGEHASVKSNFRAVEEQDALIYVVRFGLYPTALSKGNSDNLIPPISVSRGGLIGDAYTFGNSDIVRKSDISGLGKTAVKGKAQIDDLIKQVDAYTNGLAIRTGGRCMRVDEMKDLGTAFQSIAAELGQQYLLGYVSNKPGNTGERRRIVVKTTRTAVAVISRNEVVFGKPKD